MFWHVLCIWCESIVTESLNIQSAMHCHPD